MKVRIDQLTADVHAALQAMGVPDEEAKAGASCCIDAELLGHSSHGVRLLRNIGVEYIGGAERRRPVSITETPVSAQVDGGYHLSWFVHQAAVDLAAAKAHAVGIGIVSVRHAGVSGALGSLVERVAATGLVCIAVNSTPVTVVAPETSVAALGTNPLSIGVPRRGGQPVVLDMATSSIAFNQVLRLRETGGVLPNGVATDDQGTATTDPALAIDPASGRGRILPFGGHRGYGLALMIELMVAAGVTGRTGAAKRGPVVLEPDDFSAIYIAYQPGIVGDPDAALDATDQLLEEVIAAGGRVPGESGHERRAACLRDGSVDVDDAALQLLASLLPG